MWVMFLIVYSDFAAFFVSSLDSDASGIFLDAAKGLGMIHFSNFLDQC